MISALYHPGISTSDATTDVTVSVDELVVVEELTVVVYTGMSWSESVGGVALQGSGSAGVTLKHQLSAEGHTASVAIYATFDDGTYEDVTGEASLVASAVVVACGRQRKCWVEGPAGGGRRGDGALQLEASLSVCGVSIAEGQGVVMLNMPNAISVDVSSSRSKVTKSGDGAICTPSASRPRYRSM